MLWVKYFAAHPLAAWRQNKWGKAKCFSGVCGNVTTIWLRSLAEKSTFPLRVEGEQRKSVLVFLSYRMGFVAFHMVPCNIKAGALILWLYAALCFVSCQSTVEVTDSLLPPRVFGSKRCDSSQMCHSAWYTLILILEAWGKTVVVIEIVILSLIGFETLQILGRKYFCGDEFSVCEDEGGWGDKTGD